MMTPPNTRRSCIPQAACWSTIGSVYVPAASPNYSTILGMRILTRCPFVTSAMSTPSRHPRHFLPDEVWARSSDRMIYRTTTPSCAVLNLGSPTSNTPILTASVPSRTVQYPTIFQYLGYYLWQYHLSWYCLDWEKIGEISFFFKPYFRHHFLWYELLE